MAAIRDKDVIENVRRRAVHELLRQQSPSRSQSASPAVMRSVEALERQAPDIVVAAKDAGVEIEYVGVSPLFGETRLYGGDTTDWVMAPVRSQDDAVVPRREREVLKRLAEENVYFPLIYSAHEVEQERTGSLAPATGHTVLERSVGAQLVGPIPAPHESVILADRLAQRSQQVVSTVARVGRAAGIAAAGVAMAPLALVGGALAGLATLDPIILGAMPAISSNEGEPAAWFVLVRWDW